MRQHPNDHRQLMRHQPRREAWVDINLDALAHNLTQLLALARPLGVNLMAVLKADAYGHGVAMTLPLLMAHGVGFVAVSNMDEAIELRQMSQDIHILVLGPTPDWALDVAAQHHITLAVADAHQLPLMQAFVARTGKPLTVHIKLDTGMHRVGLPWQQGASFVQACLNTPLLNVEGVFSHLANGANPTLLTEQLACWQQAMVAMDATCGAQAPVRRHILNSPGLMVHAAHTGPLSAQCHTMVRIGMGLWGYEDLPYAADQGLPLNAMRPVMGLKGRITHLQTLPPQQGVSYGPSYTTTSQQCIATIPMGYADGVPRALSNQLIGLCRGVLVQQVGTITMDQMMWNVTDVPDVALGDTLTLLSSSCQANATPQQSLTLTQWADRLNTIPYELMCALRVRLPKVYQRD
jgi:alanine racemase